MKLAPEPAHDNKVIIKVTPKPADITNFDVEVRLTPTAVAAPSR